MDNLWHLVDSILVPHSAFVEGLRRMTQCFDYAKAGAQEPVCLAMIGEARTGKSRCAEVFIRKHMPLRLDDGLHVPVISIVVPSKPTVKNLAELALASLGVVDWEKGTENAKTKRLQKIMNGCKVHCLVLDEFHHFYDKTSHKVQHYVTDWLKNLVGETKTTLFVSGLPSLQTVIDQNEQLTGRFLSPIHLPRFDWLDENHRSEWYAILGAFTEGINNKLDFPELDSDEMALRMYCATGGLMGYLTKTLRQAVWNAADNGSQIISIQDLEVAHKQAIWSHERFSHLPNPFDRNRSIYASAEVLAQTKLIGTPLLPESTRRRRKSQTMSKIASASHILSSR